MPKTKFEIVTVLDNIRSLYNVGSIFRSSDGFGVNHLYLCGITGTPSEDLHKKRISKTSLGSEETVPWSYSENTLLTIQNLKKNGFKIISLEQTSSSIPLNDLNQQASEKVALVVGHELFGVSESVLNQSDLVVNIPMKGQKESLNVTVAYGITAYYLSNLSASK